MMSESTGEKNWLQEPWLWLIFLLYLLVAGLSFNRGILLGDEGYQLFFAWVIARGEKIYKDYELQVFPLSFLLQALLIKAFGLKLILFKLYSVLFGIAGFFSLGYLARKITSGKFWLFSPALYIFFSNNLFHFPLFSVESKLLLIVSLAFSIAGLDLGKRRYWFGAGFFAGMACFEYQTLFGLIGIELLLVGILWDREKPGSFFKALLFFLLGFLLVSFGVLIYLAWARLLEETFWVLFSYTWAKKHVWRQLLHLIFPIMFLTVLLVLLVKKLWQGERSAKILALSILFLGLGSLIFFWARNPQLISHSISLLAPTVLFSLAGIYCWEKTSDSKRWLAFGISALLFLFGLLSGYNLGYNIPASLLLIPWIGFLIEHWQQSRLRKIWGLSPAGLGLLVFLFSAFLYLFIFRLELAGEVEPIYQSRFALDLKTARGIYTSQEKKADLEALVKIIQQLTEPKEKIWVFPMHVMIYPLSERAPVSRSIYFFYEIVELKSLESAVEQALKNKALVIFQLKAGKIFQPLNSAPAQRLIQMLSESCQEKIWLNNYLVCQL